MNRLTWVGDYESSYVPLGSSRFTVLVLTASVLSEHKYLSHVSITE